MNGIPILIVFFRRLFLKYGTATRLYLINEPLLRSDLIEKLHKVHLVALLSIMIIQEHLVGDFKPEDSSGPFQYFS